MRAPKPNILFIDAYDSFTNNIISLLTTTLSCSVRVVSIDTTAFPTDSSLYAELRHYDAVVCGPGPGSPLNDKDVGLMKRIWALPEGELIPVLGICLGFQSLATTYGAGIKSLEQGLHGMVRRINYISENEQGASCGIFEGVGEVRATLYQSLCIGIGQDLVPDDEWETKKWLPGWTSPNLQPLAWVEQDTNHGEDRRILVAVQHTTKPFWGLQYHPESICTNLESRKVVRNWFVAAREWNRNSRRQVVWGQGNVRGQSPTKVSLLEGARRKGTPTENIRRASENNATGKGDFYRLDSKSMDLPDGASFTKIVEALQGARGDQIILDSSNSHVNQPGTTDVRGRYSIIALDIDNALTFEYSTGTKFVSLLKKNVEGSEYIFQKHSLDNPGGIWGVLASYLEDRKVSVGNRDCPFWGGFVGYTTYELGLESIDVNPDLNKVHDSITRPDLCFAWVEKSVVVDHQKRKIHIQELVSKRQQILQPSKFLEETLQKLETAFRGSALEIEQAIELPWAKHRTVRLPSSSVYEAKVQSCQDHIRRGEAYELCLTDQTEVKVPISDTISKLACANGYSHAPTRSISHSTSHSAAWAQYKKLRAQQPAPFASFLRLGGATFISASPERFLKWDAEGRCELRPMKGTVKKTSAVSTLAQAEALLQIPKEQAENLMIVDLVRHDLYSVCGPGNVSVPRLMVVEEYASVFQMISIVQGQIPPPSGLDDLDSRSPEYGAAVKAVNGTRHTGIDVLAASLPPGSMTGAPKKRSCEILQEIEGARDRSLYSGVVGYMDVGGRGDFSVNIRCMFRWDDKTGTETAENWADGNKKAEVWHIGAGGAVTALSTPLGEREEMQTKLQGTLGVFR